MLENPQVSGWVPHQSCHRKPVRQPHRFNLPCVPEGVRVHSCDIRKWCRGFPTALLPVSPTSFPTAKGACLSLCQTPELVYSINPHSSWGRASASVIFLFFFWVPSQNTGDKLIASLSFLTYSGWNFLTAWLSRIISACLQFSVRTFPHMMYIDVCMRGTESHILLHYLDSTSSILTILVQIVIFLVFHKENLHFVP